MCWFELYIIFLVKLSQKVMVSLSLAAFASFSKVFFTLYKHGSKLHVVPSAYLLPFWERIEFALSKHLKCSTQSVPLSCCQRIQKPEFQSSASGLFWSLHSIFLLLRKTAFLKLMPSTSLSHLHKLAMKISMHMDQ